MAGSPHLKNRVDPLGLSLLDGARLNLFQGNNTKRRKPLVGVGPLLTSRASTAITDPPCHPAGARLLLRESAAPVPNRTPQKHDLYTSPVSHLPQLSSSCPPPGAHRRRRSKPSRRSTSTSWSPAPTPAVRVPAHGGPHTIPHQALCTAAAASSNSHLPVGQLLVLRRLLGGWSSLPCHVRAVRPSNQKRPTGSKPWSSSMDTACTQRQGVCGPESVMCWAEAAAAFQAPAG